MLRRIALVLVPLTLLAVVAVWVARAQEGGSPLLPAATADPAEALRPVGVFPLEGDVFTGRFVAYFDEALAWDRTAGDPLIFEPALPGTFSLEGNHVAFTWSGRGEVGPARVTVRLSEGLRGASGLAVGAAGPAWTYPTRQVAVQSLAFQDEVEGLRRFALEFTTAVSAESLKSGLVVTDGAGAVVTAQLLRGSRVGQPVMVPAAAGLPLTFTLRAGLAGENGAAPLAEDFVWRFPLEGALMVGQAKWVEVEYEGDRLDLMFNENVPPGSLLANLSVTVTDTGEAVPFTPEAGGATNRHRLRPNWDGPWPESVTVALGAGLASTAGHALGEPWREELSLESPDFNIRYHNWNDRGVDGPELYFNTSAPVSRESLESVLSVKPAAGELTVEEQGWRNYVVRGDFLGGMQYELTLGAGLKQDNGRVVLEEPFVLALEQTPKTSGAKLGHDGSLYFPRRAMGPMPVRVRNMDAVTVESYELLPGTIAFMVENLQGDYTWDTFAERYARKVGETTLAVGRAAEEETVVPLALEGLFGEGARGVYGLRVAGAGWPSTKIVLWTDLGVLAHWQSDALLLYVHDLDTLAPVAGAKATVWSSKNQVLGEVMTDGHGVARLGAYDASLGVPRAAVVETTADWTFLELEPRRGDETGFKESMPPYLAKGYDGFVYCDRNLYRPGETVHARWVVRDAAGEGAAAMPVVLRVVNPKGQGILEETLPLSAFGTGAYDYATSETHLTGQYRLALRLPGEKTDFAWAEVNLEEFVPNRLEVKVESAAEVLRAGVEAPVTVLAANLSGPPAADRKCTAEVILLPTKYEDPAWPGYRFGNDDAMTPKVVALGEAQTDAGGAASFTFRHVPDSAVTEPLRARVRGEVMELGGRSVKASIERVFLPADVLLGLATTADADARSLGVRVAAVDAEGQPAAAAQSARVVLERQRWRYYVRRENGQATPHWDRRFEEVRRVEVPLAAGVGETALSLADHYGYYRVRVESDATTMVSTQTFYAGWGRISVAEDAQPSLVKLALEQPSYQVGEEVVLRVETPFDGAALVVLQGNDLGEVLRVPVKEGVGEARFIADRGMCPNVWAEVTVVHGAAEADAETHPYSSFAMVNVPVKDPRRTLEVALSGVPEEVRPGTAVDVGVTVRDASGAGAAAEVTLAAVDDGIHAILDYANPDPAGWFARARRADYRRAHYYDKVAYDFEAAHIGGGMLEKRLGKDTPQDTENWIKPVALWSGVVTTDASGAATVRLDLPEFNGRLRLVAVAANAVATGAAHDTMLVRRPYMLRTSMPRFALPGDVFTCRAVIFNTTDQAARVRLGWSAEGSLGTQAGVKELDLPAGTDVSATADFTALETVGQGVIHWRAEVLDASGAVVESLKEVAPLPVLEPVGYRTEDVTAVVDPGGEQTFKNLWFKEDARLDAAITVGGDPFQQLREALEHVVGYPYGCVEQTTSRCLPMYLLHQSGTVVRDVLPEGAAVEHYLRAGIDRLISMQLGSGGLSFWPGGVDAYAYGSVYACHFLTLVHRDGVFAVPEEPYQALRNYVRGLMNDSSDNTMSGLYLRSYALYVLALEGDLEALESIARFDDLTMPRPGRYLLAAALAMNTKDPARVAAYLAERPSQAYNEHHASGVLNTEARATAVELLALVEMGASPEAVAGPVKALTAYLVHGDTRAHAPTTQEMAFVCTAMGSYLRTLKADAGTTGGVLVTPAGERAVTDDAAVTAKHAGPGAAFTVRNTGDTALYVNLAVSGIPTNPVTAALSEGLSVERRYVGPGGSVSPEALVHGETYLVDLALRVENPAEHVVVADLLPPGLEVENPRLDADALAGYNLQGAATPSHLEVRDDRLVAAFDGLDRGVCHLYYLVRAVTPGTFQHPPATAECMYMPDVRGRSASGRAVVSGK